MEVDDLKFLAHLMISRFSSIVTDDVTITTTVQATAIAASGSTYVDNIACGQNTNGPDDNLPITVICEEAPSTPGSVISVTNSNAVADWDACVKVADDNSLVTSFEYVLATK